MTVYYSDVFVKSVDLASSIKTSTQNFFSYLAWFDEA